MALEENVQRALMETVGFEPTTLLKVDHRVFMAITVPLYEKGLIRPIISVL
jgi:hypothetical protein